MSKSKIIIAISGGAVLVLALGGGGWYVWNKHHTSLALTQNAAALTADAGASTTTLQPTSGQSIPVPSADSSSNQDSSGLNVTNGAGSTNLGQLDPNASVNANNGTDSSSSSSSSSSSNGGVDPTKFGQYDQYKDSPNAMFGDVVKGTGATLGSNQKATVVYAGWLTNGTLFDESKTGSDGKAVPFTFTEGAHQVISGWEEGVSGMQVGGTRLIIVPPALGYGSTGQGSVPPNAVLVFEVQLLSVQ